MDSIDSDLLILTKCCENYLNVTSDLYNNLIIESKIISLKNNHSDQFLFRFKQKSSYKSKQDIDF